MRGRRAIALGAAFVALLAAPASSGAGSSVTGLAASRLGVPAVEVVAAARPGQTLAGLVSVPETLSETELESLGLRPIVPGIATIHGDAARLAGFARAHPTFSLDLAPPLRTKLDLARPYVGAAPSALPTGLDGRGVYVGIVDTGVDIFHDDFRAADGSTRVAWLLDFSQQARDGNALDQAYGARVFDRAELDLILKGSSSDKSRPTDVDGHGTHVAGIAAASAAPGKAMVGVAPGADLVVVRAARGAGGSIYEADAVLGARFVFDMAKRDGKPAVVNLSIGTQFGPHDGTSTFERGLTALAAGPGRAVVVAASNEGDLPMHTSLRVTRGVTFEVPIVMAGADGKGAAYFEAQTFVWLNFRDGGDVRVGLAGPNGSTWVPTAARGDAFQTEPEAGVVAVVANEPGDGKTIPQGTHGAVVIFKGALPSGEYRLLLEGDGAVEAWVEGVGDAADGPAQPLFRRGGLVEGTIGVPASAAGLIAMGCVYLRQTVQASRYRIDVPDAPEGRRCRFSSAGPAANGVMRPDLLAPGYFVISSMSRPALENGSIGDTEMVDPQHVWMSGTSMSTPFGTGAVALLFQKDPTLGQERARALLMAGARRLADDWNPPDTLRDYANGAGILDVTGALLALERKASPVDATDLQLRLGGSYLASDGKLPLWVLALARDASGRPADVPGGVTVELEHARLAQPLDHPAVGLYRFSLLAEGAATMGNATIRVRSAAGTGPALAVSRQVPVGADRWDAKEGLTPGGACALGAPGHRRPSPPPLVLAALAAAAVTAIRRRSRSRSRAAG